MSTETSKAERTILGHSTARAGMYLTFRLAGEEFGLEILKVREIVGFMRITAIPKMPAYMKGMLNLRGHVIPVVDLRVRFGLPEAERTDETCIIVVDVGHDVGLVVDAVSEVLDIPADEIEPPPALQACGDTGFLMGMAKVEDQVKILLNIDKVLTSSDVAQMVSAAEDGESE